MKRFAAKEASDDVVLTVVCAMRNMEHCVEGFLDSYRSQRTSKTQLIVIDGASADGTWAILERYWEIIHLAVSEADRGIYDAWNKALPMCTGRYVSFIGADDRIADGGLGHLVAACRDDKSKPHIIAGFNILTKNEVPVLLLGAPYDSARFNRQMMIAHVMCAHRLDWLVSVRGFDASYRSSGDYELLLREHASLRVETLNVVLAYMEDGGASRTSLRPIFENYRARLSNGIPLWLCVVLLARALLGRVGRGIGLRK